MSLLTYQQAATRLGVSVNTLRVQAMHGRLPTVRNEEGKVRIEEDAIKEYQQLQRGQFFLKRTLQELLQGTLFRPEGVQEEDWRYMKWYARNGVTLQKIADHYKVSRQRVEQRIYRGLTAAGVKGLDRSTDAL